MATQWDDVQGTVQVRTPDRSMDVMLNGWLLIYQSSAGCGLGRRSIRQGAPMGSGDQLQDVLASWSHVASWRATIFCGPRHVSSSKATFSIGGIPRRRGVRTRISDDVFWLPYVVIAISQ